MTEADPAHSPVPRSCIEGSPRAAFSRDHPHMAAHWFDCARMNRVNEALESSTEYSTIGKTLDGTIGHWNEIERGKCTDPKPVAVWFVIEAAQGAGLFEKSVRL
jgi:hypothetical protein